MQTNPFNTEINLNQFKHLSDGQFVIIKTEWNQTIVDNLELSCIQTLNKNGILNITTIVVPGAVEIPFIIKRFWENSVLKNKKPIVFIALGCIIKGDTPHFEYVCQMLTDGITLLNLSIEVPTIMGVLTVNNLNQALERSQKGEEFAISALKMATVNISLK